MGCNVTRESALHIIYTPRRMNIYAQFLSLFFRHPPHCACVCEWRWCYWFLGDRESKREKDEFKSGARLFCFSNIALCVYYIPDHLCDSLFPRNYRRRYLEAEVNKCCQKSFSDESPRSVAVILFLCFHQHGMNKKEIYGSLPILSVHEFSVMKNRQMAMVLTKEKRF